MGHDLRCMGTEDDAASNAEPFSAAWLAYVGVLTGACHKEDCFQGDAGCVGIS